MKKGRAVVIPAIPRLTEHADAIRRLGKQTVESIIEIGRRLFDCRDNHLEHGEWGPWLEREFGWSDQQARRFIHVFELSKANKLLNLDVPLSAGCSLRSPADRPWPPPQRGGSPAPCRNRGVSQTGRLRAIVSAQCPRYLFGYRSGVIGPPERERPRAVGNTVEAIGSDTKSDYPTTARPASGCAS